ncbi:hypothetical protein [Kluyvera cryocrescens]|uniref:hypothetical protein n=1 Tax=Kluyvera cryocrescens TaxID=580 RepID=UPI002B1847E6|nr:hypothetical protein [Kluyvera cryocrescens]HEP1899023.1 hypothetical protein [Kluyvera cryocrescens]
MSLRNNILRLQFNNPVRAVKATIIMGERNDGFPFGLQRRQDFLVKNRLEFRILISCAYSHTSSTAACIIFPLLLPAIRRQHLLKLLSQHIDTRTQARLVTTPERPPRT